MLMGFSCGDDYDTDEGIIPLEYETRSTRIPRVVEEQKCLMEEPYHIHGTENDLDHEFRPVEHPLEPADEDHPVKYPMPDSSVIQKEQRTTQICMNMESASCMYGKISDNFVGEGRGHEKRFSESLRKRSEVPAAMFDNERMVVVEFEPPVRSVRKRHHTFSNGSWGNRVTPVITMNPSPPAASLPTHGFPILQMLQQSDKFES